MPSALPGEITALLARWGEGDSAALTSLASLAYDDLRAIASGFLRREGREHTLQATALVNELYLRLVRQRSVQVSDRRHFYTLAAMMMRRILTDYARQSHALKRPGGQTTRVPLHEDLAWIDASGEEMLALDQALAEFDYKEAAITLYILGQNAELGGHLDSAVTFYEQGLADLGRLGKEAPVVWDFRLRHLLGHALANFSNGRLREAQMLLEAAIAESPRDSAISKVDVRSAQADLGQALAEEGRDQDAETTFQQAMRDGVRDWLIWIEVLRGQITISARRQDFAAAREFAHQAYEVLAEHGGRDHVWTAEANLEWARFRAETGEVLQAMAQVQEAMPLVRKNWPHGRDALWLPLAAASHVLVRAGHFEEAERYARESLAVVEEARREEADGWRAESLELVGAAVAGERRDQEAIPVLERARAIYAQLGPGWSGSAARVRARIGCVRAARKAGCTRPYGRGRARFARRSAGKSARPRGHPGRQECLRHEVGHLEGGLGGGGGVLFVVGRFVDVVVVSDRSASQAERQNDRDPP